MPFNAQTWIDDIVRTSHYILPDELPDHGDLDASPDDLVKALAAIRTTQVDANPAAALMPARVPQGSHIPSALNTHFEDVVQGLSAYGIELHPAVRHALLAVALSAPDRENKLDAMKPLMTGIDNGFVYQPTMTWTALLRPQWYDPKHYVTPVLKGGVEPSKSTQGVTSAIVLTEDNMRINAAHMFSWAKPVELTQAKIPAPPCGQNWPTRRGRVQTHPPRRCGPCRLVTQKSGGHSCHRGPPPTTRFTRSST